MILYVKNPIPAITTSSWAISRWFTVFLIISRTVGRYRSIIWILIGVENNYNVKKLKYFSQILFFEIINVLYHNVDILCARKHYISKIMVWDVVLLFLINRWLKAN